MPIHEARSIIHLNIADFAARLETMASPTLKDRPVVIASLGATRAVVYGSLDSLSQGTEPVQRCAWQVGLRSMAGRPVCFAGWLIMDRLVRTKQGIP